jgi:glycosidase
MPSPVSIRDIDLAPLPGKTYFNTNREWQEEFIYFLMVDRFQDNIDRAIVNQPGRSAGIAAGEVFYGGTINGVTQHLDYIAGLGCTAIWLSPVFVNTADGYHGYHICNYLDIDPHFGTKDDLVRLVELAHNYQKNGQSFPIRIILDVVINHSGDNWSYPFEEVPGTQPYMYWDDTQYPFGSWRDAINPIPAELRDENLYHRMGNITDGGYDRSPENLHGDLVGLKDYNNDDTGQGSSLVNILIKAHCYWIREADIDGFRVDAVKHMGALACAWFCSNIREYAYSLGKKGFFLFGELATPDSNLYNRYIGPNTSVQDGGETIYFGIDSLLDFRLAEGIGGDPSQGGSGLRDVITGVADPSALFQRLKDQEGQALNRGQLGRYLVGFVDNHDSFWQPGGRIGALANDAQVIAAIGFLLCALGTPCIYYGTEQGFTGRGGDADIREALFSKADGVTSLLNTNCNIYQSIAAIAAVVRAQPALRFGRMYYRPIAGNTPADAGGGDFGLPFGSDYTLAFSRMLYGREVLVAYNVSGQPRKDFVVIDNSFHQPGDLLTFLYGKAGTVIIRGIGTTLYVQLELDGHQWVILA